jgi:hypothetical protein
LLTKIKEARAAALKDLIDRQLIIQAFKKEGFQIPDHFLDQRIQDMIRRISMAIATPSSRLSRRKTTLSENSKKWRAKG